MLNTCLQKVDTRLSLNKKIGIKRIRLTLCCWPLRNAAATPVESHHSVVPRTASPYQRQSASLQDLEAAVQGTFASARGAVEAMKQQEVE